MSTRSVTKWLNKARRISNTISDLKEEDREEWTRDYFSGTRTAVGPRFQNLGKYLSTRRQSETADRRVRGLGETIKKQYRTMATARVSRIDEIEAEELASRILQTRVEQRRQRWLDPVWRAELARDLREEHAGTYEEDIEVRLERGGLNIEAIEMADLESRAGLYDMRRSLAQEMLAHLQRVRRGATPPPLPPDIARLRAQARVAAVAQRLAEAGQGMRYKHKKSRRKKGKRKKTKSRKNT